MPSDSLFDRVGGQSFFDDLVELFYDRVSSDILLRPMYSEDLTDAKDHLAKFLGQYWGGPTTYADERGHPRLRMRHAPFDIDTVARDHWLAHMRTALLALRSRISEKDADDFDSYLEMAAHQLRNR